jgi:transmembrane sensor
MDERIIKYYANELDKAERKALLEEAFADKELKQQMMEYQNLQSLFSLHSQKKNMVRGEESLHNFMKVRTAEKGKKILWNILRYAAVILVCVFSTYWITCLTAGGDDNSPITQELSVPPGQRAHIILPDGSKVWVNAGSVLSYPSVFGEERRVKLSGEAFFEVAKGDIPFIVSTDKADIRALGTKFNVFSYSKGVLSVALLEGAVKVYKSNQEQHGVILKPNQLLTEAGGRFYVEGITESPVIWKEGLYAFNKKPLADILKKLELYYDVEITVLNSEILGYECTGKFRQRDGIMEVLRIIQKVHPFKIKREEDSNKIILYR